jgi:hypothetical protein
MKASAGPVPRDRGGRALRVVVLGLLAAAPLAVGSVFPVFYVPLLAGLYTVGIVSWARGHWARAQGAQVPRIPGRGLLLAAHALVVLQLLPLPPWLLRLVSPGTYAFHDATRLLPLGGAEWRPITVDPILTLRGLAFLGGMTLLYATVVREFGERKWRRRLAFTVVGTGFVMTLVALVQAASGTTKIYGVWRPIWDWAVFGPYVNRLNFAGFLVLAIPLALALTGETLEDVRRAWRKRRHGWTALGDPAGTSAVRRAAVSIVLVVGLISSGSRGGFVAGGAAALALFFVFRKGVVTLVLGVLAITGVAWVGLAGIVKAFESRGLGAGRFPLWADGIRIVPDFPAFGSGFNAYQTISPLYQRHLKDHWVPQPDCEYLEVLVDTGVVGAALVAALIFRVLRSALRHARDGALAAGVAAALVGCAVEATVHNAWQVPGNVATLAALCALATRGEPPHRHETLRANLDPRERGA